ncbi:M36 family metallopeptidase [Rubricoccus marinus]|uniref:FTP domain-containing protein n=1 Tax=Rubricoccus marinus TaxID=716817 RepID=A0A259TVK8_9BACT|nr:M36 family metallopeptidase [Rubricoccus marinus]OZC01802.1 hypothetical protein BSZ36_01640 [Rubricoccus marinus]
MRLSLPVLLLALVLAAPASAQDRAASSDAVRTALTYLRAEAGALGLKAGDLADLSVASAHEDPRTGATYVYVQQRVDGIEIAESIVTVTVGRDGRVAHAAGDVAAGTTSASKGAGLTPEAALARVASLVGEPTPSTAFAKAASGVERRTELASVAGDPVTARLVYVGVPQGGLRLAWEVMLPSRDTQHLWLVRVDAQTGAELSRYDLVVHDAFGPAEHAPAARSYAPLSTPSALSFLEGASGAMASSYRVYPFPLESPHHGGTAAPPADGRSLVANPFNLLASPNGWHDSRNAAGTSGALFTTTQGNNVHAYTDTDANNIPDTGSSPDGGAGLVFDAALDLTQNPSAYRPASVINLFYWNNIIHDVMVQYGFTEAAGNFQTTNYSGLGAGGDYVQAESQDGGGTNNANFSTPVDGFRPRMQMYVGVDVSPNRDGSFDNGVVIHEYGHGISNRLTGGPAAATCLQNAEQQGEGWSDFYAVLFTMKPTETRTTARGIGTYLFAQGPNGIGIRLAPYSTDFAVNSYTYGRTKTMTAVHQVGFVWATILHEATWDLIDQHGFSDDVYNAGGTAGNQIMLNLVTQGLKMQPCSPGFVSSRDAILAADALLYPDATNPGRGRHYTTLWKAFARRGLGVSASQGVTTSNVDNVEAFDAPLASPSMVYAPGSLSFSVQTGQRDSKPIVIRNTAAPGSGDLNVQASLSNFVPSDPRPPSSAVASFVPEGGMKASGEITVRRAEPLAPEAELAVEPLVVPTASRIGEVPASAKVVTDCASGQLFEQLAANLGMSTISGALEVGQSFTATCTGFLNSVIPVISASGLNTNQTWGFTMRVYAGTGTSGTLLASPSYTYTNPASGAFLLTIPLPAPVEIVEGQTYTWFLDMTSGRTGLQYDSRNPYAGGTRYTTVNGNPANAIADAGGDMQFQLAYGAPERIMKLSSKFVSVPVGGSATMNLNVDATGFPAGTYTADLVLTTNVPSTVTMPVTVVVGATAGSATITGSPGWYLMASPTNNTTIEQLASMNLVAGLPGYYPTFFDGTPSPTLYNGYRNGWTASTGAGETFASGQAFLWYFWNSAFVPTEPTPNGSAAVAFPVTLTAPGAVNTADVSRVLHTVGDRINVLGNPFGTPLDLTNIKSWPGGGSVASKGRAFVWDPVLSTWISGTAAQRVEAWQGFAVQSVAKGGTLTIPASAAVTPSAAKASPEAELRRVIAFELEGRDAATGRVLLDRSAEVAFEADGADGWDDNDAQKLQPLAASYVSLGVESTLDGERVLKASESRALAPASFEVPLALETVGAEEVLTLTWPQMTDLPADWQVTLRDVVTGETLDLRRAQSYAFEAAPRARKWFTGASAPEVATSDASASVTRFVLSVKTGVSPEAVAEGFAFGLAPVSPNPSRGVARVTFTLEEAAPTVVAIYDVQGREVARLADGQLEAGRHEVAWQTGTMAPGVYVLRLASGGRVETQRAVVVR